jgi:2,3-bisphosphoglycerate-independent phosphoglycerate mutase
MKYIILIGDGMADYPIDELDGKTPLEFAKTPNMDRLARDGTLGLVKTIPDGYPPGSDVANLSILGYNPERYYTGRSPLEAASIGIKLEEDDVSFRCNLVNLSRKEGKVIMGDYSAGHISTDEAREIISNLDKELTVEGVRFYPGVGYRHLMVWRGAPDNIETTPPHDISGREIEEYLPRGDGADKLIDIINQSQDILKDHPVNRRRKNDGKVSANSIWLWGQGRAPDMPKIKERYGIEGSIISAVDLMKGLGIYAGLRVVKVPGVTGYIDTNYRGKVEYALRELNERDLVCVHIEAPDEASHNGNLKDKIKAIEDFDCEVVGRVMDSIKNSEGYRALVMCDHATPLSIRTHTDEPVPFIIYPPVGGKGKGGSVYSEDAAAKTGVFIKEGYRLLDLLLQ